MERRIAIDSTTTLEGYCRLRPALLLQGEVTTPKARVKTRAVTGTAFVACTVDTVDVEVTAPADRGTDLLAIESAAIVAGRRYLLDTGPQGVLDVVARSDGTVTELRLASALPLDVPAGATLKGHALLRDLTAEESSIAGDCSIEWQATVGGQVIAWTDLFRVVRRMPQARLTTTSLLRLRPQMRSLQIPEDVTFEDVMAGAWEGRILPLCEAQGLYDEEIVSDETLLPLHALACVLQIVEDDPRYDRLFVEDLRKQFRSETTRTFARSTYDEQSHDVDASPRSRGRNEDRGNGLRVTR